MDKYIIHFTDNFDKLNSILSSGYLRLKYCEEIFMLGNQKISSAAHPMICFSEYNLEEIKNKTITYGKYGIAFSHAWVQKNKIQPVLYIDKDSSIANALAQLLRARQNKLSSILPKNLRLPVMTIKCFTKNCKGYNSYLNIDDFDFRAENEWRYIPLKKDIGYLLISQNRSTYCKNKQKHNIHLLPYSLPFTPNDIEYIFVKDQNEIVRINQLGFRYENKCLQSVWL